MARTKAEDVEELDPQDEIAELKRQLAEAKAAQTEAEQTAEALSHANQFINHNTSDFPTGETVVVKKCINPWVRDEKQQKFAEVSLPVFKYTLNLPVSATSLSTNGVEYYHGMTYEFNQDELAEIKSRENLCWRHEASIHGENENVYRKRTERKFG